MHGRKLSDEKNRTAEELEAIRIKTLKYSKLSNIGLQYSNDNIYNDEAFAVCTSLLKINPDFYTMWNFRRRILINKYSELGLSNNSGDGSGNNNNNNDDDNDDNDISSSGNNKIPSSEQADTLLQQEYKLTQSCISKNPKSYSAWYHRQWCSCRFMYDRVR